MRSSRSAFSILKLHENYKNQETVTDEEDDDYDDDDDDDDDESDKRI